MLVDANKAGPQDESYRSYGTATADGVLSLQAIGRSPVDPRVRAAADWLVANHAVDAVPGFADTVETKWTQGLWFYYAAASTSGLAKLGLPHTPTLTPALLERQRPDGSWVNPEKQFKEDDPLIATALAVRALVAKMDSGQPMA